MFATDTKILNILILLNIGILGVAYFIEYILKIPPCSMCIYQRIPYYLAVTAILLSLFKILNFKKLIIVLLLLTVTNLGLSFYHIGIEQGFFEELSTCANNLKSNDINNLLNELKKQKIVSCKDISFTIFGFSLATINFAINLGLMLLYSLILKNEK